MKKLLLFSIAISACLCASLATAQVPLPQNVVIAAPNPELKKEVAAFSGKWAGNWSGVLDAMLVVEQVGEDSARVIYAWGAAPSWNTTPGSRRFEAKVTQGDAPEIAFGTPPGMTFSVKMNSDLSTVDVTRVSNGRVDKAAFQKVTQ